MLPNSEQTQQLLEAARGGDSAAVNNLLERHRDSLRRMVQARLDKAIAQRVDASDVVQDVLLLRNQGMFRRRSICSRRSAIKS